MIQIRQAKDDLAAKGFRFFLGVRAASTPLGMPGRVNSPIFAREAGVVEECTGDFATLKKLERYLFYAT
jgi:hypothetical protein